MSAPHAPSVQVPLTALQPPASSAQTVVRQHANNPPPPAHLPVSVSQPMCSHQPLNTSNPATPSAPVAHSSPSANNTAAGSQSSALSCQEHVPIWKRMIKGGEKLSKWMFIAATLVVGVYLPLKSFKYQEWTAGKDFRDACLTDSQLNLSLSQSCRKALSTSTQTPPFLMIRRSMFRADSDKQAQLYHPNSLIAAEMQDLYIIVDLVQLILIVVVIMALTVAMSVLATASRRRGPQVLSTASSYARTAIVFDEIQVSESRQRTSHGRKNSRISEEQLDVQRLLKLRKGLAARQHRIIIYEEALNWLRRAVIGLSWLSKRKRAWITLQQRLRRALTDFEKKLQAISSNTGQFVEECEKLEKTLRITYSYSFKDMIELEVKIRFLCEEFVAKSSPLRVSKSDLSQSLWQEGVVGIASMEMWKCQICSVPLLGSGGVWHCAIHNTEAVFNHHVFNEMFTAYNEIQQRTILENLEMQKALARWNPMQPMSARDAWR